MNRRWGLPVALLIATATPAATTSPDASSDVAAVARLRAYEAGYGMPNFVQRYNMTCSSCHTTIPRLNRFGYEFRRAGYRMPEEIAVEQVMKFDNSFAPGFSRASITPATTLAGPRRRPNSSRFRRLRSIRSRGRSGSGTVR